jgi:ceramide glucosyltransferase
MTADILAGVVCFAILYQLIALWCVHEFFSRKKITAGDWMPPLSVLKPLKGLDADAFDNLASFVRQDYPAYEVLFGVESERDPVVSVIRRLLRQFPRADIRLIVTGNVNSANRKIGILAVLSRHARYGLWVISDSDTRVSPTYLKEIVRPFRDPKIGMVTCLYRTARAKTFAAVIESLMIHVDFFPAVLVAERLEELQFGLGATMAVRRGAVGAIGGFDRLRDYIADDYELGHRIHQAGYRVVLSTRIIDLVVRDLRMTDFFAHQVRWARTYKVCRPNGYLVSILTHGSFLGAIYLLFTGFSPGGWILFSTAACVRLFMTTCVLHRYLKAPNWRQALLLLPVKELLSAAIWAAAFLGNRITWKGKTFKLQKDGRMLALERSS